MFGDKFAFPSVFLEQCLQTIAAGGWVFTIIFSGVIGLVVSIYLIIYTKYRWIIGLYLLWIWVIDKDIAETGGRISPWVRSWLWWKYNRDYFPLRCEKLPGVELDPKKNYLMCCFPHGLIGHGPFNAFSPENNRYFPHHKNHVVTLSVTLLFPFLRDLLLGLGAISASAKSIEYILNRPEGGHLCVLVVGGAREASYCKPGIYRLTLKDRKGFVKLALRAGAPLVPVFSFGEIDLYDQLDRPLIKSFQDFVRKWTRVNPIIMIGRFGFLPHRRMVTTVVGKPLEIPKILNPTQEEIDKYHEKFIEKLTELFEEQKYNYLGKPEDKKLIID